jgi:hypothetical protein
VTPNSFRRVALSMPGVVEASHMGIRISASAARYLRRLDTRMHAGRWSGSRRNSRRGSLMLGPRFFSTRRRRLGTQGQHHYIAFGGSAALMAGRKAFWSMRLGVAPGGGAMRAGPLEISLGRGRDRGVLSRVVFMRVFSTDEFLRFLQRTAIGNRR